MLKNTVLTLSVYGLTLMPVGADGLEELIPRVDAFFSECAQFLEDPVGYAEQLPPTNLYGGQTVVTSSDGNVVEIQFVVDDYGIGAGLHRLSDRIYYHCEYTAEQPMSASLQDISVQFADWLVLNPDLEVIGGHLPPGSENQVRHTILGLFPGQDALVVSNIYEQVFWIYVTQTIYADEG